MNDFREKINKSGVNSINCARIICQIVYYFYAYFSLKKEKISFSVPTGNFGDIYAGYVAKKMGLPINKLIVATNENDIIQRVINTGEYKPYAVKQSITPSMDIQVASNFERLLFYILDENDQKVSMLMNDLSLKGSFNLDKEVVKKIKKDFEAVRINDEDTQKIIKNIKSTNKNICHIFFEIDYRDDKMITKILKDNDFSVLAIENDLSNRPRCIVAKMN